MENKVNNVNYQKLIDFAVLNPAAKTDEIIRLFSKKNMIKDANEITIRKYGKTLLKYCLEHNNEECFFENFSLKLGRLSPESRKKLFNELLNNFDNLCCLLVTQIYFQYFNNYDMVHSKENDIYTDADFQMKYVNLKFDYQKDERQNRIFKYTYGAK